MSNTRTAQSYPGSRVGRQLELPTLASALAVAAQGCSIFPLPPYTKTPSLKWSEAATCDLEQIQECGWPKDANIGIACKPTGWLVVDLDRHKHDGVTAFTRLCEEHETDGDWPDTYTVETPTRGYHLVFANPDPERYGNSSGGLPLGIDVRGGGEKEGGYVLAAGSVVDRRAYEGKPDLQAIVGSGRAYVVDNDTKVIEAPDWIIRLLEATPVRGRGEGERKPGEGGAKRPLWSIKVENADHLKKRVDGAVQKLAAEATGSHNRNNLCFWTACTVGEVVAAGRADLAEAEKDLMDAMEKNGFIADHDEYSARATIRSGFKTAGAL
jgi:hypothetical protein